MVNFGASDGYHLIGNMKKEKFKKGYAFEISKKERDIPKINLKKMISQMKLKFMEQQTLEKF